MRLYRHLSAALAVVALSMASAWPARADTNSEMVVKAVMIRKFVEFIKWPDAISPQKNMVVNVCVYGDSLMSQMNPVFDKTAGAAAIKFSLHTLTQLDGTENNCHILFLAPSKQDQLSALRGRPILTVSDAPGFAEKGGMIGFIVDGKVRYNINNKAFSLSQLKIDAQLLEIANKVVE